MKKVLYLAALWLMMIGYTSAQGVNFGFTLLPAPATKEFKEAYAFASQKGITTQPTIEEANMEGKLIRSHMAKMLASYAIKELHLSADTAKTCHFDDLGGQSEEMKNSITLACQLGIMGLGITSFSPETIVTRAEFWTALSRMLYGNAYNDGTYFYSHHLQILKEKGIITSTDPDLQELRGYVMIMLMRADTKK